MRESRPLRPSERRARQRAFGIAFGILLSVAVIGAFYAIWTPAFRIRAVQAAGPHAEDAQRLALATLQGTYLYLVPHDSIFFYSPEKVRTVVLDAFPDVDAVSVHRDSLHGISLSSTPRATSFVWCGAAVDTPYPDGTCYDADSMGLVFATSTPEEWNASSTLRIFGALDASAASPIRAHVVGAEKLPDALRLVKALRGMGAPISALALRDNGEADLWVQGPTRITYLLGQENQAAQLAQSSFSTLQLTNGSIQYVDLRFPGKVYVKRYGQ